MNDWPEPSELAKAPIKHRFEARYAFPFEEVPKGKSFAIARNQVSSIGVLRTITSRAGKRLNKKFRVVDHGESGYEVYCIPDVQPYGFPKA